MKTFNAPMNKVGPNGYRCEHLLSGGFRVLYLAQLPNTQSANVKVQLTSLN